MRLALLVLVACGGSSSAPPAAPAPSLAALPESATDVQVATVNGRPVWGSCVAHQGKQVVDGLAECIGLELMAQAAEARGLARDTGVVEAARIEMVNRLVATDFEAKVTSYADFGGAFDAVLQKNLFRMHQPDIRTSTYVRAPIAADAPSAADATAHAAADRVAAALRDETGLFPVTLTETADRIAKETGATLEHQDVGLMLRDKMAKPYADALYGIPAIGRIAEPVRTKWGWDVILWTGGLTAKEITQDDLSAGLFPELRQQFFKIWVERLRKAAGITVAIDPSQLEEGTGS